MKFGAALGGFAAVLGLGASHLSLVLGLRLRRVGRCLLRQGYEGQVALSLVGLRTTDGA